MSTPKDSMLTLLQMIEANPLLKALLSGVEQLRTATSPPHLSSDPNPNDPAAFLKQTSGPTPDFSMMLPTVGAGRLIGGARLRGPVKTWEKLTAVERAEVMKDFPKWTEEQLKTMELFTEYNDLLKRFGWAAKSRLRR